MGEGEWGVFRALRFRPVGLGVRVLLLPKPNSPYIDQTHSRCIACREQAITGRSLV